MTVFNNIVKGLNEAIQYEKGLLKGKRHVVMVKPLPGYKANDIKNIRVKLKLPQSTFAQIIGVSPKTIEAWESGRNVPNGPSQRVLELLDKKGADVVKDYVISR
ncbi:MAG: helix-turn-helix domain-containing protein [Actinobacteria bacterium]|nr:helix-turn-helix domain-containing protein [Actinomycetota bacterium]